MPANSDIQVMTVTDHYCSEPGHALKNKKDKEM
jgi:hypothetical protein